MSFYLNPIKTVLFGVCLMNMACGDALMDASYRGETLFSVSGVIEAAPDVGGADLICSSLEFDCMEHCENVWGEFPEPGSDAEPFEDNEEPDEEAPPPIDPEEEPESVADIEHELDQCFNGCFGDFSSCLEENKDLGFSEAYYDTQDTQRIAILWANPGRASTRELHQRTMTSTDFPARYSFSVYGPPPANVLFDHEGHRYAYGLIVSFIDRNNDERLDIREEPIIGLNMTHGVMFMASEGTVDLERGYQIHRTDQTCFSTEGLETSPDDEMERNNVLSITGTTPFLFESLPDVDCENGTSEWLSLCEMSMARNHCAGRNQSADPSDETPEPYDAICSFCNAANQAN
jgi:hypothetical protein